MTPAEIALLLTLLDDAIVAAKDAADAAQLKKLEDVAAKLRAQLLSNTADLEQLNADVKARDEALEAELAPKP